METAQRLGDTTGREAPKTCWRRTKTNTPPRKGIMEAHAKGRQEAAEAALGFRDKIEKDIVALARVRQREANMRMRHEAALEEEKNRKIKHAREQ